MPSLFSYITLVIMLLMLISCGGGGDGNDNSGLPPPDSIGPNLNLTASSIKASPGQDVIFTSSVSDNVDQNISGNLACDAGTLSGDILTIPDTLTDMTVECTYSATDQAGNQSVIEVSIQVIVLEYIISSLEPVIYTMSPVTVEVVGLLELEQIPFKGSVGTEIIDIIPLSAKTLTFVVPAGVSGDITYDFFVDGMAISVPLTVVQLESPANPEDYVSTEINSYLALLEISIQETNDPIDIEARRIILEAVSRFDELSESDFTNLSILLTQLSGATSQQKQLAVQRNGFATNRQFTEGAFCQRASAGLIVNGTGLLASLSVAIFGAITTPETGPLGLFFTGAGLFYVHRFKPGFKEDLSDVIDSCGVVNSIELNLFRSLQANSSKTLAPKTYQQKKISLQSLNLEGTTKASVSSPPIVRAENTNAQLRNDESASFDLVLNIGHEDPDIAKNITNLLAKVKLVLVKIEETINGLTGDLITVINNGINYTTDFDAKNLALTSVSHPNIFGSIVSAGSNSIQLVFSFHDNDLVSDLGREDFNFTLTDNDTSQTYSFSAALNLEGLPIADEARYTVMGGEGFYGVLTAELADSFEFTNTGTEGLATLLIPETGQFGYDAPTESSGEDVLEFIAINATGTSAPAKIIIDILSDCEREEEISTDTYVFYHSIICYESNNQNDDSKHKVYRDRFIEFEGSTIDYYTIEMTISAFDQLGTTFKFDQENNIINQELTYRNSLSADFFETSYFSHYQKESADYSLEFSIKLPNEATGYAAPETYSIWYNLGGRGINSFLSVVLSIEDESIQSHPTGGGFSARVLRYSDDGILVNELALGEEARQWYFKALDKAHALSVNGEFLTENNSISWNDHFNKIQDRYVVPWYVPIE